MREGAWDSLGDEGRERKERKVKRSIQERVEGGGRRVGGRGR